MFAACRRGVILLSTLVSLISVVTLIGSLAIANTRTVKRLTAQHQIDLAQSAARELMRPQIAEAMFAFDTPQSAAFWDTPHPVVFEGVDVEVLVTVVERNASGQPGSVGIEAKCAIRFIPVARIYLCKQPLLGDH